MYCTIGTSYEKNHIYIVRMDSLAGIEERCRSRTQNPAAPSTVAISGLTRPEFFFHFKHLVVLQFVGCFLNIAHRFLPVCAHGHLNEARFADSFGEMQLPVHRAITCENRCAHRNYIALLITVLLIVFDNTGKHVIGFKPVESLTKQFVIIWCSLKALFPILVVMVAEEGAV